MFYVYVLQSESRDDEIYVGITIDLRNRMIEHNKGLNTSTARYTPWKLIYYEACLNKSDATRREGYFKKTQGRRALRARLKEHFKSQRSI